MCHIIVGLIVDLHSDVSDFQMSHSDVISHVLQAFADKSEI